MLWNKVESVFVSRKNDEMYNKNSTYCESGERGKE